MVLPGRLWAFDTVHELTSQRLQLAQICQTKNTNSCLPKTMGARPMLHHRFPPLQSDCEVTVMVRIRLGSSVRICLGMLWNSKSPRTPPPHTDY